MIGRKWAEKGGQQLYRGGKVDLEGTETQLFSHRKQVLATSVNRVALETPHGYSRMHVIPWRAASKIPETYQSEYMEQSVRKAIATSSFALALSTSSKASHRGSSAFVMCMVMILVVCQMAIPATMHACKRSCQDMSRPTLRGGPWFYEAKSTVANRMPLQAGDCRSTSF
eukprot:1157242-Pelagomonas_calceolata.AAC.2